MDDKEIIEFLLKEKEDYKELVKLAMSNSKEANVIQNKTLKVCIISAFIALTTIIVAAVYFYFNQDTSFIFENSSKSSISEGK